MVYQIFIVEDHPVVRETYGEIIHAETDMNVCGMATSGEEALEHLGGIEADLVLVDLSLPGMNGFDLIKQLKVEHPHLPAIILSGHPASQYELLAQLGGAVGYVDKVEVYEALIPLIRSVLSQESDRPLA